MSSPPPSPTSIRKTRHRGLVGVVAAAALTAVVLPAVTGNEDPPAKSTLGFGALDPKRSSGATATFPDGRSVTIQPARMNGGILITGDAGTKFTGADGQPRDEIRVPYSREPSDVTVIFSGKPPRIIRVSPDTSTLPGSGISLCGWDQITEKLVPLDVKMQDPVRAPDSPRDVGDTSAATALPDMNKQGTFVDFVPTFWS